MLGDNTKRIFLRLKSKTMGKQYRLYVECLNNEGWESHITKGVEYQLIAAEFNEKTKKPVLCEIQDDKKQPVIIPAVYFSNIRRKEYKELAENSEEVQLAIHEAVELVVVMGQIIEYIQVALLETTGCRHEWKEDIRKVRFAHTQQKNNLLKYISVNKEGRSNAAIIQERLSSDKLKDLTDMVWYANKFHNVEHIAEMVKNIYLDARRTQEPAEFPEDVKFINETSAIEDEKDIREPYTNV